MFRLPSTLGNVSPIRYISTSPCLLKNRAGKKKSTQYKTQMITYDMAQKPHHLGSRKAWLSWHTHNLEEFRHSQKSIVAQDEIIRRFIRGFFPKNITVEGEELVIKRRGNSIAIAGFFRYSVYFPIKKVYWMFGFTEEFLSILLKQPVTLEIQFVDEDKDLAYNYI